MHQPPSFAAPVPGGELGTLSSGLQSAVQASQGFEVKLPWSLELKGTLFIQRYFGMTNAFASCSSIFDSGPDTSCLDARVNGRSVGLEAMLKRSFSKRVGGWISYTFSRSIVEVPHPARNEASEVPSNFDRTHVLQRGLRVRLRSRLPRGRALHLLHRPPVHEDGAGLPGRAVQRLSAAGLLADRRAPREALAPRQARADRGRARGPEPHVQQGGDLGAVRGGSAHARDAVHAAATSAR